MSKNKKTAYKSLFQSQVNFLGGIASVQAADDHFIYTISSGYSENYKRFFFADIQAIKMVKKRNWGLILTVISTILIIINMVTFDLGFNMTIFVGIIMTVLVVFATIYLFVGAPVEAVIKTAYSRERIKFGRFRRAEKNLRKITTCLDAVQNIQLDEAERVTLEEAEKVFKV